MTDLNKEGKVNLSFEQDNGAVWVFAGDSQFGTEISHLMMMHADEYSEDELRVICHHAACEIDRLRAELEKAKAQAVPETHVLVEKSKISTWWQDADEPENFASTEEQLIALIAESEIYTDDMLVVEKHVQAQLSTQKLYCVYQITNKETGLAEIKVCESKSEAEEILNNNAKWVAEKEADQYESMNAFFEEEERKSGAEQ
ncbi:hypothetical protein OHW53_11695 [Acinetobacter baumannii]|nr:hypothetical protein [Acinetobacter baumannii]